MKLTIAVLTLALTTLTVSFNSAVKAQNADASEPWEFVLSADGSDATARHETAAVVANNRMYLIGGRGLKPVQEYNPQTNKWVSLSDTPLEMHHFQPVVLQGKIYLVGGFACCYPNEPSLTNIHIYNPANDSWTVGPNIPAARRRGSNAAVVRNDKIYILGGNTQGHDGGAVSWFDEYDPATDTWTVLPDAPTARDHFAAVIIGNKLIAAGGRQSDIPDVFDKTQSAVDIYDFSTETWSSAANDLPTERAGAMVVSHGSEAIVIGGEVSNNSSAIDKVEAFDINSGNWRALQPMQQARHSGGAVILGDELHVIAGSASKGGGADVTAHEMLDLDPYVAPLDSDNDGLTDTDESTLHNTDPQEADTDQDDLDDGEEILIHFTDPLKRDSDQDGIRDGQEIALGTDPLLADSDGDGLDDHTEVVDTLSDPLDSDTDGDSLSDGDEVGLYQTDPLLPDTDADQLNDDEELVLGTDPLKPDSDSDMLTDYDEINVLGTGPTTADSDLDGLDDWLEITIYQTSPLTADTDQDGVMDIREIDLGFDPLLMDSDGDGIDDAIEIAELQSGSGTAGETTSGETTSGQVENTGGGGGGVLTWLTLVLLPLLARPRFSRKS